MIKKEKGITLVSLIITIVLMLIISSTTIYVSKNRFDINNFSRMKNDIIFLDEKVSNYYLKYEVLPILRENDGEGKKYTYTSLDFEKNIGDNENYYILDLEAMEGLALNYGKEGFKNPNASDDVYIVNEETHTIYYVRGIELNGDLYYYLHNETNIEDSIPPTKPEIKVISGAKNDKGIYTTDVKVEIIPGKDNASGIDKTTYTINDGEEVDIATLTNNILVVTELGTYEIKARSYDKNGNVSESDIEINKIKLFEDINANDYGSLIEYAVDLNGDGNNTNDWKVFYKDNTYLYIIASNYLNNSLLPNSTTDEEMLNMTTLGTHVSYWDSDSFRNIGASSIEENVANKYGLSWWLNNKTSTRNNARATADLLNVVAWTSKFGDYSKGIEAIGGPTLEMWVASWNAKGEKLGTSKYVKLYTASISSGYLVGNQENPTSRDYNIETNIDGYKDTLYFPADTNANGYWLASPRANSSDGVMRVGDNGQLIGLAYWINNNAVRPLVAIPSNLITTDANGNLKVE